MSGPQQPRYERVEDCPKTTERHTPCPRSYLAWHEWAQKQARSHRQRKCPTCGLWAVWVPK
jgi:hypothetical protein